MCLFLKPKRGSDPPSVGIANADEANKRKQTMTKTYAEKWETPVGADCINLHSALTRWLGERLIHLGEHTNSVPYAYYMKFSTGENTLDENASLEKAQMASYEAMWASLALWKADLTTNGKALLAYNKDEETLPAAQEALRWVADNLGMFWD